MLDKPTDKTAPTHMINSRTPVRICDIGGWTDTWFAEHGEVLNIGVTPYAEVQIAAHPRESNRDRIVIHAMDYADSYSFDHHGGWMKHPLLEAAISHIGVPGHLSVEISLQSKVPAGASTGTSSAVTVALIGALSRLKGDRITPKEAAYTAHMVETEMLGQQCGIQDQLCAAYGGINLIEMTSYPHANVSKIELAAESLRELERRLVLIYLGSSHHSSQVHEMVIHSLEAAGAANKRLERLRHLAQSAREALTSGDFTRFGSVMIENNEAQRGLHPALISADADRVIEVAQSHGATGWKVNGAGGEGGSISILCNERPDSKQALINAIESDQPRFINIPIQISRAGLTVWVSEPC